MFVVVNFDALAQASDFRIERRQVAFLVRPGFEPQCLRNQYISAIYLSYSIHIINNSYFTKMRILPVNDNNEKYAKLSSYQL